ncbi:MAG: isocitrate/isopropylmalate dehydrogenase family protein [Phycisphaerales bacterium]|jgi:isocitrate dehydrogenase (NAD+)|nr:isocitrate/isopropylmalate dehydrogenase family protein [Phycisphaerales bacterium]
MRHSAVLIPGDGIGPEVTAAARFVLEQAGAQIDWHVHHAGLAAVERGASETLPDETVESVIANRVALKGPCTTPIGEGFTSVNVALRKRLHLFGAVRPVRSLRGVPTRFSDPGVDIVVVRENTEGLYAGIENQITKGVVTSLKVVTEEASRRIARFALDYALTRGRRKVTVFHKANIMKLGDGLFVRCCREEARQYEGRVEYEEIIIDAGSMRLVQRPEDFDVLLCENLYGDVMSDLCAGLVGGLGVTPGANYGCDHAAVFEAVHGSAPDIAGQGIANPLAVIMSGVMMLRHLAMATGDEHCTMVADRIRNAYNASLLAGHKTRDLGGELGTQQFAQSIADHLGVEA